MLPKIGERLKRKRKQLGLTLKELAGDRITPAQISAIENGKCNPSDGLLAYLCEKMNVDIDYFILSDEERYRLEFEEIKNKSRELLDSKRYEEALKELGKAEELINYLTEEQKGYFFFARGEIFYSSDNFSKSFDLFVNSLTHYIKTDNYNKITDVYIKIGNCLYSMEKYNMAVGYYLNASTYLNRNIDNDIAVKIYYNLAICYVAMGRVKQGREYIDKCRAFILEYECSKQDIYLPGIDILEGLVQREENDNDIGLKNFEEAYEKYKNEKDLHGMAMARNNAALCLWDMGKPDLALKYLEEALELKIKTGEKTLIDAYMNISEIYIKLGELDKALEIINTAEEKMIKNDWNKGLIEVFKAKFELFFEAGNYERAETFAFLALDTIEKTGHRKMEPNIYIKMSEMYKKMGDDKASIEYILKANIFGAENSLLD